MEGLENSDGLLLHKNPGLVAKYVALDREKFNADLIKHHQVYRLC